MDINITTLKQEEFIEEQCSNLNLLLKPDEVGEHINKLEKKCGEIYICEEDVFNILCIFCETTFEEIQKFFTHIRCDHKYKETCIANVTETDPLEIRNDNDGHEDVKPAVEQIKSENSIFPKNNTFNEHKTQNSDENILMVDEIENKSKIKKKPEVKERNSEICNVCQKTFNSKRTLQRHKRREHSEKRTKLNTQFQVETDENNDGEQSKENAKTLKQRRCKEETDPLKCKYCGRRLADPSILIEHERIHTGERPCQCQICGKQFRTRSCVWRHEKTHSNIRQFKCEKCGMEFKSKVALCAHLLRHGEKKLKCNFCDKLFHSKGAKIEHERIHTGEKPYQCNFCGKCFQTGGHLNRHTRMHTGIRPYKCPYCDKCFAAKAILDNHVVIHTGERPFVCTTCNATFPRKKALKSHEKIHSDYRGYVCKICGEAFKQYPTLHGHMKSHKRLLGKFEGLQS